MGLITKEIEVKLNAKHVKYYVDLGYDIPKRHREGSREYLGGLVYDLSKTIIVKVEDLPPGSHVKIQCECDYCGDPVDIEYRKYYKIINSDVPKIACKKCKYQKEVECNMVRHNVKCSFQRPDVKEKSRETNRIKRGVDYPTQSKDVRDKIMSVVQERYGVDYIGQSDNIKEKKKQTCQSHYGCDYVSQSQEIQNKIKQNNLEKYGVEFTLQVKEFREKGIKTCLEKYGVKHPMQCKEIYNRANKTYRERYKDNDPRYSIEAHKKRLNTVYYNQSITTSNQQRYIAKLYNMELNYPLVYWNVDMYDGDSDMYVEYDGSGHDLCVRLNSITEEDFTQREITRYYSLKEHGYNMVRIISKKDYLPSDEMLLDMLSYAKHYFSDYPNHSWISFDIDEGLVKNAENKDGVLFDYGELRKISKKDL